MSRGSSGFTLLEVLVALAIIALALGAILQLATQSARTSTHLRDKTAALYVATNLSAEVELFGPPASGERRGTTRMLGHTWHWVQSTEQTAEPTMVRVTTRVFEQESALLSEDAPHVQLSEWYTNHCDAFMGTSRKTCLQNLHMYLPIAFFCRGYSFLHLSQTHNHFAFSFRSDSVNFTPIVEASLLGHNRSSDRNVES